MNGKGLVIWFTMLAGFCQSLHAQKSFGESPDAYLGQMPPDSRAASSSFWGDLQAGSYSVGFRTIFRYDSSRPWMITRHYRQPFSPDFDGRPIQINIWYPASRVLLGKKMEYKDYAEQSAPPAFVKFMHAMATSNHEGAIGSVPESETPQLLATQMNAVLNAKPATGAFSRSALFWWVLERQCCSRGVSGKPRVRLRGDFLDRSLRGTDSSILDLGRGWGCCPGHGFCLVNFAS